MNYYSIANIAIKIAGILSLYELLPYLITGLNIVFMTNNEIQSSPYLINWIYFFGLSIYSILFYLLVFKTMYVMTFIGIIEKQKEEVENTILNEIRIGRLSIVLIGVYLISIKLGILISLIYQYSSSIGFISELSTEIRKSIISNTVTFIIGFVLIIFSSKLSKSLFKNKNQI
jgi:hypothetical protein